MEQVIAVLDERLANPGDTLPVAGHLDEPSYSLGNHDFTLPQGIDYDLMLTNAGEGILATGILRAHVEGVCDRCLDPASFDVAGEVPSDEKVLAAVPSADQAYETALATRPEIRSAELSIDAADMQLDIARRGFLPTVGVSAGVGDSHYSASPYGTGKQLKRNLNASAGVTVSVPIFDNRRNQAAVKQAKLQQANSRLDLQDRKNALSSTIEQYWINACTGQQNFIAARSRAESQQQSYDLLSEQFAAGLKNVVDVLEGRDNLLSAQQAMLQSKYTTLLNVQLLKFYTGENIDL